jgi:hypothetical protein
MDAQVTGKGKSQASAWTFQGRVGSTSAQLLFLVVAILTTTIRIRGGRSQSRGTFEISASEYLTPMSGRIEAMNAVGGTR